MTKNQSLLIPTQWYHPGFRAGGPIQALRRLTENLAATYNIYILTTNRDLGDDTPYPNIQTNTWLTTPPGIKIKYLSQQYTHTRQIRKEITALQPDIIYLKSFFSPLFTIVPLWLKYRNHIDSKIVLAPSGMLKESAFIHKTWKKKLFLSALRESGLPKRITWHATDLQEQRDIQRRIGEDTFIELLPEFPPVPDAFPAMLSKDNVTKLLYLSRIHPVKNLTFLFEVLSEVRLPIKLSIGGPLEDADYWTTCQQQLSRLPGNIEVQLLGEIPHPEVGEYIRQHHVFTLPTTGENYGYAIAEALSAARPVLISDQTPWKNLSSVQAGWDLPLDQPEAFIAAIEEVARMDQHAYDQWCQGALAFAKNHTNIPKLIEGYKKML